jgi:peptidyl-prolyl cis-trans isomerase SurA
MTVSVNQSFADTRTERIAAVVNEDAVSWSDVAARMKLIMVSSRMPDSNEIKKKLRPQIVNILIDERIKLQEADRLGIEISEQDIDQGFSTIAAKNKLSAQQFEEVLEREGVPTRTIRDQIRSQIAWGQVVQRRVRPKVRVTDTDIEAMRERFVANTGKMEYLVSEIFLPVENPKQEDDVKQLAERLVQQLEEGETPFESLAVQFSQSSAAANGGDLGWVQEGRLQDEVDGLLSRMGEGEFGDPVRSLSGYHIVLLRKKRMISEDNIPSEDDIGVQLGMEQLERLQRRYLLDLRASSFVENRV